MASLTIQDTFAEWVAALDFDDLPEVVVDNAKAAIADSFAIALLGASRKRSSSFAVPLLGSFPCDGEATVLMRQKQAPVIQAAMLNAIYAHSCELDDTTTAGGHPGAVIVPTALATAEREHSGGREVIAAVVAGYEIMHRSSMPTHPKASRRGIQTTGKDCCFGATAAVAKLRKLPNDLVAESFAITGNYSCGLMEYDQSGGESKRLYAGLATRAGVEAVALAEGGVTGPQRIWEGNKGVWAVFGDGWDPSLATVGLGSDYRIVSGRMVKLYPALASRVIYAMAELVKSPLKASDIKRITIGRGGDLSHGGGIQSSIGVATDVLGAQFNIAFSCAIRALYVSNDLALYEDAALWVDADVIDVCHKVRNVQLPEDVSRGGADGTVIVTLELSDGSSTTSRVDTAPGSPGNPLSHEQYRDRYFNLTQQAGIEDSTANGLYRAFDHLEDCADINHLMSLLGHLEPR